jgi:hypothetical protein
MTRRQRWNRMVMEHPEYALASYWYMEEAALEDRRRAGFLGMMLHALRRLWMRARASLGGGR